MEHFSEEFMDTLRQKKLFLLDMDGTLYLGDRLFPHCRDFLDAIRARGGDYLYLTNNSSRSVTDYVKKMERIGIPANAGEFFTSTDAACILLKDRPYRKIYALGTASFVSQLRGEGFPVTTEPEDDIDCLLMGYDTELSYRKLEDACILLNRGVTYLATNPDLVCPTVWGYAPDCGSVSQMLFNATGRKPSFIGKPEPDIALLAMKKAGCSKEETVLIGDRIYTDIACGVNAGITTVLVFSGESTRETLKKSQVKPNFTCEGVGEIWEVLNENI